MKKIFWLLLITLLTSCFASKKVNHRNQFSCPVVMMGDTLTEPELVKDTTFNWYAGRHY